MKFKDTDFLHASARIKVIENSLLGNEALKKMAEARSSDEAWKIANDAGIGVGEPLENYEKALDDSVFNAYALAEELLKGDKVLSIFRLKYDAHNLKVLVKSTKAGKNEKLLSKLGNISSEDIAKGFESFSFSDKLDKNLASAAKKACEDLAKNNDPQAVDVTIDKAWLSAVWARVSAYDNEFLRSWGALLIDTANVRTFVRVKRMGREKEFFKNASAVGGTISTDKLLSIFEKDWDEFFGVIASSPISKYIEGAYEDIKTGKPLSKFERLCDNAYVGMLKKAHYIPFGIEPVLAWVLSKENEAQCARIIFACRKAGVPAPEILERLRDAYAQ